jgi:hypothetical protein
VKRLLFQLLVSFDFLKSILDDAIVDIKIIFKGPLTLSMKISPCTEKGTSTRLFVTICDENHIMFSFNPILDIPQRS